MSKEGGFLKEVPAIKSIFGLLLSTVAGAVTGNGLTAGSIFNSAGTLVGAGIGAAEGMGAKVLPRPKSSK